MDNTTGQEIYEGLYDETDEQRDQCNRILQTIKKQWAHMGDEISTFDGDPDDTRQAFLMGITLTILAAVFPDHVVDQSEDILQVHLFNWVESEF